MIRNHLVVGLHDGNLSLKLQMNPRLTLKTAISTASQGVQKQQPIVRHAEQLPNIDLVVYKKQHPNKAYWYGQLNPKILRHVLDVRSFNYTSVKNVQLEKPFATDVARRPLFCSVPAAESI